MDEAETRLGIAVTTYNRREMLLAQVDALTELTARVFELVVCDDGSTDGTVAAARAQGVRVIGGCNRGIAWNKNRGLFYLREICGCEVILLLDDDVLPARRGWEAEWIEAVRRWGHINFLPGEHLLGGANNAVDPGVSDKLWGPCIAFSRAVLGYVGYMDTRFQGYGHEHTDLTTRAMRAGFGGVTVEQDGGTRHRFYSIEGGLRLLPSDSNTDAASAARNQLIWGQSQSEPIYRNAWRDDAEYQALRAEMAAVDGLPVVVTPVVQPTPAEPPRPGMAVNLARGKAALQSSVSPWSRQATAALDAAGAVDGKPDGTRKFHTELEEGAWWQVDLGSAQTIAAVRIYNTVNPAVRKRFERFTIAVAFDADDEWIEVFRKEDDKEIGGIDGKPFFWKPDLPAFGRLVRITALGKDFLHLDQVEVFGRGEIEPAVVGPDGALFVHQPRR